MSNKERRGAWKFDEWLGQIIDIPSKVRCSFHKICHLGNGVVKALVKHGARHFVFFFFFWRDFFIFLNYIEFVLTILTSVDRFVFWISIFIFFIKICVEEFKIAGKITHSSLYLPFKCNKIVFLIKKRKRNW